MRTILIVERSPLIAYDIRDTVAEVAGRDVEVSLARDLGLARQFVEQSGGIDVTVLSDRAYNAGTAQDLADVAKLCPALVVIGETDTIDTSQFARVARTSAPFTIHGLADALQSVIASAAPHALR